MRRSILAALLVVAAAAFFVVATTVSGQTGSPPGPSRDDDRQVLRALLDEVRQLRLALQRANVVSHRLRVALERIRLQQARVDSLTRALEGVRSRLTDLKAARPQMEDQIKYAEDVMSGTADPTRRAELEQQIKEMRGRLSVWAREEEQARNREGELSSELQAEQTKLNDLHNRLDYMERELESL
jgi:chromosome segregation ATPase